MKTNTYLQFNGNCEQALHFYQKALDAKLAMLMRYGDAPPDAMSCKEMSDKIMHGRLTFGDDCVIMASDSPPDRFSPPAGFSVSLNVETAKEAEQLFNALSEGGNITMPIGETFWAERFGMLIDQFGVPWMINCDKK